MSHDPAPKSPPAPPPAGPERPRLGAAAGQLGGWAALAALDAALIEAIVERPAGGARIRLLHHLYGAGNLLAVGLVAAALIGFWQRFGPRRPALAVLAVAALAVAVGVPALDGDFSGFAERIGGQRLARPIAIGAAAAVALAIPAAALLCLLVARRPRVAPALVALAAALFVANLFIASGDYEAIHAFVAAVCATLIGGAIACVPRPAFLIRPSALRDRALAAAHLALALAAVTTVVVPPRQKIWTQLFKTPSAVVAPLLVAIRSADGESDSASSATGNRAWFSDRSKLPPIQPGPPLLPASPVVVLITVDALRADMVADERNAAALPNFAALRAASTRFSRAYTPAPQTVPAITALFSGRYYSQTYWVRRADGRTWAHRDASIRFPEILSQAGVATVTFASLPDLTSSFGTLKGMTEERVVKSRRTSPLARELAEPAIERLKKHDGGPLFLYLHFTDPHAPYDRAGEAGSDRERYLGEVALVDREIGRIWETLVSTGLSTRTAFIVTADHGEAFGEHNTYYHAVSVYEELLRIPLFIRLHGAVPRDVDAPVTLLDLGPTVLDLFGQATPSSFMGQSLVPLLRGERARLDRPIIADTGRMMQALVGADGLKAIRDLRRRTSEIYDLSHDPGELDNLADDPSPEARERLAELQAFFRAHTLRKGKYKVPYRR